MDNWSPHSMSLSHMKTRGKKKQMEKEWKQRVERDNFNLLGKMERIMTRSIGTLSKARPAEPPTSLGRPLVRYGADRGDGGPLKDSR